MLKLILGLMILAAGANADIEVKMNTKALYREIFEKLSDQQQNYINDNMDTIKDQTNNVLRAESKDLQKAKMIDESNAVEFILNPDGTMSNFKYLMKSDENRYDGLSKRVCEAAVKKYPLPKEPTPIRMVFEYKVGKMNLGSQRGSEQQKANGEYIQTIPRGTTRFNYSADQQIRQFETTKDGFVNANLNPPTCGWIDLLTEQNEKVRSLTYTGYGIYQGVPKGKYKLLMQTKETCNVNIQYP
ncbi:hypothetical protein [Sulfuricurvum sp.]|uniref:hypothetical protein n=1 Tax=Sulfuricurvum sp. TaxID=2025608 RepID=UPI00356A6259